MKKTNIDDVFKERFGSTLNDAVDNVDLDEVLAEDNWSFDLQSNATKTEITVSVPTKTAKRLIIIITGLVVAAQQTWQHLVK